MHIFTVITDVISHSLRVMLNVVKLSKKYKLKKEDKLILIIAALMHDVGKLMIPKDILFKKEKLTLEERNTISKHSDYSYEILKFALPEKILYIIKNHHNIEEIRKNDLLKIIFLADVYDALTSKRAYKKAITKSEAKKEIESIIKREKIELKNMSKKLA